MVELDGNIVDIKKKKKNRIGNVARHGEGLILP